MSRIESHWGYCSFLEKEECIYITYSEIRAIGMKAPQYKKGGFTCEHGDECQLDRKCPIYQDAPLVED